MKGKTWEEKNKVQKDPHDVGINWSPSVLCVEPCFVKTREADVMKHYETL